MVFLIIFIICLYILNKKDIKKVKTHNSLSLGYKLFYTDQKTKIREENIIYSKLLYSEKYNLKGKPDYIFKKGNVFLPIELKSSKIKNKSEPYLGDFFQLITYFVIVEEVYGKVKYGKLIYSDYTFIIKNKKRFKKQLLKIIKQMRNIKEDTFCNVKPDFKKCKHCVCRFTVCKFYND